MDINNKSWYADGVEVKKTKTGWTVRKTDMPHGCLAQGGVCGRRVLYTRATLASVGIDYDDDPGGRWNDDGVTAIEALMYHADPDRVLRKGVLIQ